MDVARLIGLAGGHAEARAIQTALKLGLFEALRESGYDAKAIAAAITADRRATMLLANALVAMGILSKNQERYELTEISRRFLLESSPEYLGGMILFDEALWATWGELDQAVRTGHPARMPDMFQSDPAETGRFMRAMDSLVRARGDARWTAERLDLSTMRTLADLGGGPGTYLAEFLSRWPNLHGVLLDLPGSLEIASSIMRERAVAIMDRVELRQLDYNRDEIPGPLDGIFMSNIIHSENEAANADLIEKCFRALNPGGLLIIKDHIMNSELTEPAAGAVFALYLLLTTRGRDYSFEEVSNWMHGAGFSDVEMETLPAPPFTSSLVLARKPSIRSSED